VLFEFEIVVVVVGQVSLRHRNRKSGIPLRSKRDLWFSIVCKDLELHSILILIFSYTIFLPIIYIFSFSWYGTLLSTDSPRYPSLLFPADIERISK